MVDKGANCRYRTILDGSHVGLHDLTEQVRKKLQESYTVASIALKETIKKDGIVAHKITQKTCGAIVRAIMGLTEAKWEETWFGSLKTCWAEN